MIPIRHPIQACERCGYRDSTVYNYGSGGTLCVECWRSHLDRRLMDFHHLDGRPNPKTLFINANLHARITEQRASWPGVLFETGDPLLTIASHLRTLQIFSAWISDHLYDYAAKALGFDRQITAIQSQAPAVDEHPLLYSDDPVISLERVIFSIYETLLWAASCLGEYSDFLIAMRQCLVDMHGEKYWETFKIAPLPRDGGVS